MIKVALTNLGKYNEGQLIYTWLELPCTSEEMESAFEKIGINEEYEEYMLSDWEHDFKGLEITQYTNLNELNDMAEILDEYTIYELEQLDSLMENYGYDINEAIEKMDDVLFLHLDNTCGESAENEELAYQYVDMLGGIDCLDIETLKRYFDFEQFGKDLKFDFTVSSHNIATSDNH